MTHFLGAITSIGIISVGFHSEYWYFDESMTAIFGARDGYHGHSTVPYYMEGLIVAVFGIPTAILGLQASKRRDKEKINQLHNYFTISVRFPTKALSVNP